MPAEYIYITVYISGPIKDVIMMNKCDQCRRFVGVEAAD